MMGMPLADMFRGYLATSDSPSRRAGPAHRRHGQGACIQPISHMGTNVTVVAGAALAFRNRGEDRVALTWVGDGATKTAACHEGMNLAAVQSVPAVFVIQNNQVALGTRVDQHSVGDLRRWPEMYGIPSWPCDGNNLLDVYAATRLAAARCRAEGRGPAAVVAETFRMGGHATHDEREARETFPPELFEAWGRRDPVGLYEAWLLGKRRSRRRSWPKSRRGSPRRWTGPPRRPWSPGTASRPPESALYEGFSEGRVLVGLDHRPL